MIAEFLAFDGPAFLEVMIDPDAGVYPMVGPGISYAQINVAGSILGLDITGEDVEGTGLVWEVGDADQCCRPVAGIAGVVRPGCKRPSAQVLGTMYELDGRPSRADPRHVLAGVVARCEAAGLTPVVAVELEFYLLERDADGRLVPSAGMLSGERRGRIDAYGLGRLDDMSPLFDDLYAAAASAGPARAHADVRVRAGAVRDHARAPGRCDARGRRGHPVQARGARRRRAPWPRRLFHGQAVRGTRRLRGCTCTPVSPTATANNACAADDPAGSSAAAPRDRRPAVDARGRHGDLCAQRQFVSPFPRRMSYAPVAATWGVNNRSVSLRVPAGPPASRHVEHRVAGADANPYLVAALVLGGMLHGIERELDPGPPVEGNGYAQAQQGDAADAMARCARRARRRRRSCATRSARIFSTSSSRSSARRAKNSARS